MKILIVYATTDGQTRRIARRAAETVADRGHAVELIAAEDAAGSDLSRYGGVVLAGSVHAGGFQKALAEFAHAGAAALNVMPTLFLAVSLSAAGHDAADWAGLGRILEEFREATGWTPGRVEHVAGAYLPSRYDVFRGWAMKRILAAKDPGADLAADREYTDWGRLEEAVTAWLERLAA
jgi:menaquinone-dependent protoporphyrinogen oxidase